MPPESAAGQNATDEMLRDKKYAGKNAENLYRNCWSTFGRMFREYVSRIVIC